MLFSDGRRIITNLQVIKFRPQVECIKLVRGRRQFGKKQSAVYRIWEDSKYFINITCFPCVHFLKLSLGHNGILTNHCETIYPYQQLKVLPLNCTSYSISSSFDEKQKKHIFIRKANIYSSFCLKIHMQQCDYST